MVGLQTTPPEKFRIGVAFRDKVDHENNKNKSVHFVLLAIYNGTLTPVPIAGIQVVVL